MRVFENLEQAVGEIRRDVYKGVPTKSTRVQQFDGVELSGKERVGYQYAVLDGFPATPRDLIDLGVRQNIKAFCENPNELQQWLTHEMAYRLNPGYYLGERATEELHPALSNTFEGSWLGYTYTERLLGAKEAMAATLAKNPDTRRAYWPIFRPEDSIRAMSPTRIPCSLAYEGMIRMVGGQEKLMLVYLSRSVDFDTFWLSDLWLARQFQAALMQELEDSHGVHYDLGMVIHYIISLHWFDNRQEVY